MGCNLPVNMDKMGINREQDHFRLLNVVREFLRVDFECRRLFPGCGPPLLGGFSFIRHSLGRSGAGRKPLGVP
jgi:hypothetical protein